MTLSLFLLMFVSLWNSFLTNKIQAILYSVNNFWNHRTADWQSWHRVFVAADTRNRNPLGQQLGASRMLNESKERPIKDIPWNIFNWWAMQCNLQTGQPACSGHVDSGSQPRLLLTPLMGTHPRVQVHSRQQLYPVAGHCNIITSGNMSRGKDNYLLSHTSHD